MASVTTAAAKLTYADYLELPDDGKYYELIEGELVMNPSPIPRHQIISRRLAVRLSIFVESHSLGEVLYAPMDVVLNDENVLQPDMLFVSDERRAIIGPINLQGPPDLVIEILSDSTRKRDEIEKRKLYERFGVAEYWIVDPVVESVKVHRLGADGRFERVVELTADRDDVLTTTLLPELQIALAEIFLVP